jgi:peptidoglycan/LPS O-acetylase OafA/YrhL
MTVSPDRAGPFYPRVEALRGIAALLVAGMHAAQAEWHPGRRLLYQPPHSADPVWEALASAAGYVLNGHGAVILFFVISGFVLSLSLERGPAALLPSGRRFFVARLFRLYPAVFVTVMIFVLIYYTLGASLHGEPAPHYSLPSVVRNALLIDYSINGVLWTLQIEVLAAPLVFLVHRLRGRFGDAVVVALSLVFVALMFTKKWTGLIDPGIQTLQGTFAFLFGMLVPALGRVFEKRLSGREAASLAVLAALAFFLARGAFGHTSKWSVLAEAWAGAAFISLLVYGPDLRGYRFLDLGIVRFYGKISYSFYLFHPLTLMVIWKMPETIGGWIQAGTPRVIVMLGLWSATSAVVAPFAVASYKWVEGPSMKVGRRLGARSRELAASPPAPRTESLSQLQPSSDERI